MAVKKLNLSKSRKKVFDGSFEGAELPCVIIFAWFCIHLAVACETFSHNAVFSDGKGAVQATKGRLVAQGGGGSHPDVNCRLYNWKSYYI